MESTGKQLLSIVIPVYNERENVLATLERIEASLGERRYEVIYVNDGSSDDTAALISEQVKTRSCVKLINLSRNFGHQAAISAGLEYARGAAVVVMDGDLQDPPELIPGFIEKWEEGYEVVYAIRVARKEHVHKRLAYFVFYRLLRFVSYLDFPVDSGDFSLMSRRVVDQIVGLPERERFVRGIRTWVGFKQIGLRCERDSRAAGNPKYSVTQLVRLALDGLVSFSRVPLTIISRLGLLVSVIAFLGILLVLYFKLFTNLSIPGFAATATLILFMGGIQLLGIGVLGEYIARIFDEVKGRPSFIVESTLNTESLGSQDEP